MLQRALETRQHCFIEIGVVEIASGERNKLAPLIAQSQHLRQQPLALGEVAIAMQQHQSQRRVQRSIVAAKLHQRPPRGFAVKP